MFIGRERELQTLNRAYLSDTFQFWAIYGRRRVGKTALINKFIENKQTIYMTAIENNSKQNLANLSKAIYEYTTGMSAETTYSNFQEALEQIFRLSLQKRIILVIDEYPYIARTEASLSSTLQMLIDKYKNDSKLMLILCGSSMSYMVDKVLAYKAPLYGRRNGQIKLLPFTYKEVRNYFKRYQDFDAALVYGIVGGTPQYMLQFDDRLSIEDNIKATFLNTTGSLYEEPENLLKQEIREAATYNAIVTAIANGASKLSEIANKIGEETNTCSAYLKNLIMLGIVRKELPYGDNASRKAIYSIADNMFRFWYRFIPQNVATIARGMEDVTYKRIEPYFSEYMGAVFEDICKEYLWQQLAEEKCSVNFADIGRWWGTDSKTRKQVEIDIMGEEDKNTALFAECKWTNEMVDLSVLEAFLEKVKLFNHTHKQLYLFAKTGFTQGCIDKANSLGNVKLVKFGEMR